MLNKKVQEALNNQINAEFWSAYFYLSMSAFFTKQNLPGFANWMRVQFQEETSHALKLFDYVGERGGEVILEPIAEVKMDWKGAIDIFEDTLKHEQKVTGLINNLMNIALEEKDNARQDYIVALRDYWLTYYSIRILTLFDFKNNQQLILNN